MLVLEGVGGGQKHTEDITDECEKSDKHIIDDVDIVSMLRSARDPADEEENPDETKRGDEESVDCDEQAQRFLDVIPERVHLSLELFPLRVHHMPDVIVEEIFVFL